MRNASFFKEIDSRVFQLWTQGIQVKAWKISRTENSCADFIANAVQDTLRPDVVEVGETGRDGRWDSWLEDEWYGDIVYYLLHGALKPETLAAFADNRLKKIRSEATKYSLEAIQEQQPGLLYRESSGALAQCIKEDQVEVILRRFHDCHGHFSQGVMNRNLMGRYYWPGRFKDVVKWCASCDACQRLGPLRNSSAVKSMYTLQPMDLMGMDFVGPITPHSQSGSVYILIVVDYFSRYLFARATKRNTGEAVVEMLEEISKVFGWPLAFYVDNGSHFVKGKVRDLVTRFGISMFTAPVTNPRSVGLSERYVQMILAGLRVAVESDKRPDAMSRWDEHLDGLVQSINTRILKVHGYSPSQLFLGFNVRLHHLDLTLVERMRQRIITHALESKDPEISEYELRLAQIEELRELTRERVLRNLEERQVAAVSPRYATPESGDLVLRRRFKVDKSMGMKLFTKWDGPFLLSRISRSGVSGDLTDLKSGRVVGRYAFESLKVFVPREQREETQDVGWLSMEAGIQRISCVPAGQKAFSF